MPALTLVIGNKNYSSWSLRPWLLLRNAGIDFDEVRVPLSQPDTLEKLALYSPSLKVPVLILNEQAIWDSLAICEAVSEQLLAGGGWPVDAKARALARSVSAEMHSSFPLIRNAMPMNCRASMVLPVTEALSREVARIEAIWCDCLNRYGHSAGKGDQYLFGDFSIADCMYAPVALRFRSYGASLNEQAQSYLQTLLGNSHLKDWVEQAKREKEVIPEDEVSAG